MLIGAPDHWHKKMALGRGRRGQGRLRREAGLALARRRRRAREGRRGDRSRSCRPAPSSEAGSTWSSASRSSTPASSARSRSSTPTGTSACGRRLAPVGPGQARLEALARVGAGPAVRRGALLPVAALPGLRRRRADRPPHPLDRRRALVHGRRRAADDGGHHGHNYRIKTMEWPDTVTATLEYPKEFMVDPHRHLRRARSTTAGSSSAATEATLKIDRERLAGLQRGRAARASRGAQTPEPEIVVRSQADGTIAHLAELARLHPQPQDAQCADARRPRGGARRPHRERLVGPGRSREVERLGRPNREGMTRPPGRLTPPDGMCHNRPNCS